MEAVNWFWETKEISRGYNSSFVTIIPKVADPIGLGDFRPISLIGCYYKILAKILAERVKKVVGEVVGDVQNAFIKGRLILDGVLIANETMDFVRKKKERGLVFKVDFEKAYDSINWKFLGDIMKWMEFGSKWCKWVENCLNSSSMLILVNGSPTEEFTLEQGVRQGDPLSPFLFILAAKGLNALVSEAVAKGIFKGLVISYDRVVVSHLQYADDMIFFGKWSRENAKALMCILKSFEEVSGLKVNFNKSKLYGIGVCSCDREEMARWMRCSKWWWRFKRDGDSLWVRVVKSIYRENGGLSSRGDVGREFNGGRVWRDIIKVGKEIDGVGIDFRSFPRLFHLDSRLEGRVVEKGRWVEGVWRWEWMWIKEPTGRVSGEMEGLIGLLQNAKLSNDCRDQWRWNLNEDGGFTVKDLTRKVEERTLQLEISRQDTIWNKLVPKKVNVFVWRALKKRLPVREVLDKRGIDLDTVLCPCCDSGVESCKHSLALCNMAMGVWEKIHSWWKLGGVSAFSIRDFFSLNGDVNLPNNSRLLWQAVLWTSGYFIWKERNNRVFKAKVSSVNKIVQDIQLKSFDWIARRSKKSLIDWQQWLRDPGKCCIK
ncbi:reverse transcriptase domain, reverse transcriptase zinc-binding domain protein [Tanacetum coccineum]|uniref:Reverse transcriptase domain, reverse transcriptase zinc-binding domain protein n=1 Tax=Tanacetum coccineum TaxID=301880 RepID=A0ABQ4YM32_9ASTR